jgi:hypothetical protein
MKTPLTSKLFAGVFFLCSIAAAPLALSASASAQDDGTNGPPKVLVVQREFIKSGKGGALHEKTEGEYKAAMLAAKGQTHYLAMTSMSGPDRAVFLSGYPTFAAWEAENKSVDKNAALTTALDRAAMADGDLLSSTDSSVWVREDEMSLNPSNLVGVRYMETKQFGIKPGRGKEWEEIVTMVKSAYMKSVPNASWTMFRLMYGAKGAKDIGYVVFIPLKSLAEVDQHFADDQQFTDALGKDGLKKLEKLEASCVETEQTNLFQFNPKMSIPLDAWVKAEPDFWTPNGMMPAKQAESNRAQTAQTEPNRAQAESNRAQ